MVVEMTFPEDAALFIESDSSIKIRPMFVTSAGSAAAGTICVRRSNGDVLDRALLAVTGRGKIRLTRLIEVQPQAEREVELPTESERGS